METMRVFYLDNIISHNFLKLMTETIENSRALNYVIFLIFERYVEIIIIRAKKILISGRTLCNKNRNLVHRSENFHFNG